MSKIQRVAHTNGTQRRGESSTSSIPPRQAPARKEQQPRAVSEIDFMSDVLKVHNTLIH